MIILCTITDNELILSYLNSKATYHSFSLIINLTDLKLEKQFNTL